MQFSLLPNQTSIQPQRSSAKFAHNTKMISKPPEKRTAFIMLTATNRRKLKNQNGFSLSPKDLQHVHHHQSAIRIS
jgi:hypothetical protein